MADLKVTELTAATAVTSDDLLMVVDDPGGTPASRKVTLADLLGATTPVAADLELAAGQKIGIGNTPVRTLDVVGVQPQVRLRNVTTDATLKRGWVSVGHYTNAEQDVALLLLNADVSSNVLFWGGGTGSLNAATEHRFYAAPTHTTVAGTQMARISTAGLRLEKGVGGAPSDLLHVESNVNTALLIEDATGDIGIGTASPAVRLDIVGLDKAVLRIRNVTTDATEKKGSIQFGHYTNAEEDIQGVHCLSDASTTILRLGGGLTGLNTVEDIRAYTATDTITQVGTEMTRLTSAGFRIEKAVGGAPSDLFHVESNVNTALLIEDATGDIGIGTAAPAVRLDIVGTDRAVFRIRDVTTDATTKNGSIQFGHYTNAEEDIQGMHCFSNATSTVIRIGGGLTSLNTTEDIRMYAATDTVTQVGSEMFRITAAGIRIEKSVGGAPSSLFHVEAGPGPGILVDETSGDVGIGTASPVAALDAVQESATGATSVLRLDQKDLSEPFIKIVGESTTDATQSLVDAADLTTPGTITGWFRLDVQDDQGTGPITDGVYFVPFYTAPTA